MENTKTMDSSLDYLNKVKKMYEGEKYFKPEFTKYSINEDDNVEQTRDWYEVYRACAMAISKKHGIFPEHTSKWTKSDWGPIPAYGQSITDDDTLADWLYEYDGNLGQIQKDYPKMELQEIIELFTWNTMCQQRAFSPIPNAFINKRTFI